MDKSKIVAYSLLAHINNSGSFISDLTEIFAPLVKRSLSQMNSLHGSIKGASILEIKNVIDENYKLDIPIPILRKLLKKISEEINTAENICFVLYGDDSFAIKDYIFIEYEDIIKRKEEEIEKVQNLFDDFKRVQKIPETHDVDVFAFIDQNKISISKYLSNRFRSLDDSDYSIEAQFINYFKKIPIVYESIRNIYLGSILSTYLEYKTSPVNQNIELLFDTNFIIGLLDLKTPESKHTCNKLLEIAKSQGYKLSILNITITEITHLLEKKAENFDKTFLAKKIDPEDIYNACDRRKLAKTDLQRIAQNINNTILEYGIFAVPNTDKYQNNAKFSKEFEKLRNLRNNDWSALHDATTIYYVREKEIKKK